MSIPVCIRKLILVIFLNPAQQRTHHTCRSIVSGSSYKARVKPRSSQACTN